MVPAVCDNDSREIFGIFPAHLAPETKAEGSAKVGGQGFTIHAISEQRLRMESVCHVVGFPQDRKSTRLNSSHLVISYAVFCLKKKNRRHSRRDGSTQQPWPRYREILEAMRCCTHDRQNRYCWHIRSDTSSTTALGGYVLYGDI